MEDKITKQQAQEAWNTVSKYLMQEDPKSIAYILSPWTHDKKEEEKWTIYKLHPEKYETDKFYEDILISNHSRR